MPQAGTDHIASWLKRKGIPVNRKNYILAAYPDGMPTPWTAEHEAALPENLQDMNQVEDEPEEML